MSSYLKKLSQKNYGTAPEVVLTKRELAMDAQLSSVADVRRWMDKCAANTNVHVELFQTTYSLKLYELSFVYVLVKIRKINNNDLFDTQYATVGGRFRTYYRHFVNLSRRCIKQVFILQDILIVLSL